jgi:large subunit ribosomal protein L18
MAKIQHQYTTAKKRQLRVRSRAKAVEGRPKLTFNRSNRYIYLQVIDHLGKVLVAANDMALLKKGELKKGLTKTQRSEEVAKVLLADLKKKKITTLTVDRGSYKYTGRVKAAVEVIRDGGVEV